jgi:hypothetical protein
MVGKQSDLFTQRLNLLTSPYSFHPPLDNHTFDDKGVLAAASWSWLATLLAVLMSANLTRPGRCLVCRLCKPYPPYTMSVYPV